MQGVFTIFKRGLSAAFYACFIDKKKAPFMQGNLFDL
jgi:hypothetical protein